MKKYACVHRSGKYHRDYLGNKTTAGCQRAVWEGRAKYTRPGGLGKKDLMKNKRGRIVSRKRHEQGKKNYKNIRDYPKYGNK